MIKALQKSLIERIPELLILRSEDPYLVQKRHLIDMYDLSNFERAKLLMVLPKVDDEMRLSMLLDKMKALMPREELERQSLLARIYLSKLPADIHCVLFVGVEALVDVAQRTDIKFLAGPRPVTQPQVFGVPQEPWEYTDKLPLLLYAINAKGRTAP